jgi:predicted metal-dependent phosphoesterase TrpH
MLEAGHVQSFQEAFDRYIGNDGPAYVEREKMTPREAVETLRRFEAPAVLAHPRYMKDPESLLIELKDAGLAGLEVFHKDSDEALIARFSDMAKRYDLLPTGGSDYHALPRELEREPGNIPLPDRTAKDFLEKELPWVSTQGLS